MKKIWLALTLLFISSLCYGQNDRSIALNSMVATEYQFAKRALQVGSRDAFLEFISDDGILFRPTPVNGKEFLQKQNSRPGCLIWFPAYAFISKSGDLGCTTGPAEFKRNMDSASIWYGNFCTVWQLQKDGKWKFLIDGGISNKKPVNEIKALEFDDKRTELLDYKNISTNTTDKQLIFDVDKKFNSLLANENVLEAYSDVINEETRLLREGGYPIIGTTDIMKYIAGYDNKYQFEITDGKISGAGDFGYVYGSLVVTGSKQPCKFNYIRIWRNDSGKWKIVIELFSPLSE